MGMAGLMATRDLLWLQSTKGSLPHAKLMRKVFHTFKMCLPTKRIVSSLFVLYVRNVCLWKLV